MRKPRFRPVKASTIIIRHTYVIERNATGSRARDRACFHAVATYQPIEGSRCQLEDGAKRRGSVRVTCAAPPRNLRSHCHERAHREREAGVHPGLRRTPCLLELRSQTAACGAVAKISASLKPDKNSPRLTPPSPLSAASPALCCLRISGRCSGACSRPSRAPRARHVRRMPPRT